jgi:dihydrofolate reductase
MADIVLVAALAQNRVIGRDNRLIWRLKSDMRHFRTLTLGKPMIMGRKTFDSIGKPLPGRRTIIITRDKSFAVEGAEVAHGLDDARKRAAAAANEMGVLEIIVAGGSEIYTAFLPEAQRLELTEVAISPPGDALFPEFSPTAWKEIRRETHKKGPDDEADFAFVTYAKR